MTKRKSKGAYMISSVAEMYGIHPQTLRLYEREGLLKPSRTEGNTRLYTDEDLQRLEFILSLARDLGVNIAGMAIILQMRERMEEMQHQIQEFVQYIQQEVLTSASAAADPSKGAIVPVRQAHGLPHRANNEKAVVLVSPKQSLSSARALSLSFRGGTQSLRGTVRNHKATLRQAGSFVPAQVGLPPSTSSRPSTNVRSFTATPPLFKMTSC
jgi:MerR family transcriptional regulator, heat shock protein HspR